MEIRLDHIGDEPFEWSERWTPAPAELEHPDVVGFGEVETKGRITRLQAGFHLRATLAYRQTLRCVRCLAAVEQPRTGTVELLVLVGPEEDHPQDLELTGDDLGVVRLAEPRLTTRRLWIEHIQLEIPMRPLCREDCAGLCSECGADLNAGPCACPPAADPRWTALAALRDRGAGEG